MSGLYELDYDVSVSTGNRQVRVNHYITLEWWLLDCSGEVVDDQGDQEDCTVVETYYETDDPRDINVEWEWDEAPSDAFLNYLGVTAEDFLKTCVDAIRKHND